MRLTATIAALFAAPLVCAKPCAASIFGHDDRYRPVIASGSPFNVVGLVEIGMRRGSGVIVSPCYAITSQHIVGSHSDPVGKRLRFTAGQSGGHPLVTGSTVVASGGYDKAANTMDVALLRGSDWALLRMDRCIGTELGYATLTFADPRLTLVNTSMESAGFPGHRPTRFGPLIDPHCSLTSIRPLVILNDCATLPGDSGGPIFRVPASAGSPARLVVYGLQAAGFHSSHPVAYRPGLANQATPAWEILAHIGKYVRADLDAASEAQRF